MRTPDWQSDDGAIQLYCDDYMAILPTIPAGTVDAVVADPPYLTDDTKVPIVGPGAGRRISDSNAVGIPWGYSLEWISACRLASPAQWLVYANYRMLAGVCHELPPQTVFVWRKSNAPRMTRPVPRLDCEFVIWSRGKAKCGQMGEFDSMVIDVPMPQAGCFAGERILEDGTGKAAHPCQKPLAIVVPFVQRMDCKTVCDPFLGSGTTGVACIRTGRRFIGIEKEPAYFNIAVKRIKAELAQPRLFTAPSPKHEQATMFGGER
jgi:site-specific DNA-methyltransferase (adenine-specific)